MWVGYVMGIILIFAGIGLAIPRIALTPSERMSLNEWRKKRAQTIGERRMKREGEPLRKELRELSESFAANRLFIDNLPESIRTEAQKKCQDMLKNRDTVASKLAVRSCTAAEIDEARSMVALLAYHVEDVKGLNTDGALSRKSPYMPSGGN